MGFSSHHHDGSRRLSVGVCKRALPQERQRPRNPSLSTLDTHPTSVRALPRPLNGLFSLFRHFKSNLIDLRLNFPPFDTFDLANATPWPRLVAWGLASATVGIAFGAVSFATQRNLLADDVSRPVRPALAMVLRSQQDYDGSNRARWPHGLGRQARRQLVSLVGTKHLNMRFCRHSLKVKVFPGLL